MSEHKSVRSSDSFEGPLASRAAARAPLPRARQRWRIVAWVVAAIALAYGCSRTSDSESIGKTSAALSTKDAGAGGAADQIERTFAVQLPRGLRLKDVAIGSSSLLTINRGASVASTAGGFARVVNASETPGAGDLADISGDPGNVYATSKIRLASAAHVHGFAKSTIGVEQQDGAVADDGIVQCAKLLPLETVSWSVTFPALSGDATVNSGQTLDLPQGASGSIRVLRGGTLRLRTGTYFVQALTAATGSTIALDNAAGPIAVYIRDAFTMSGTMREQSSDFANVLVAFAGDSPVVVSGAFRGTLIADHAPVTLQNILGGHVGAFFGRSVVLAPSALVVHRPFARTDCATADDGCGTTLGCDAIDTDGDGLSDCAERNDGDGFTDPEIPNGMRSQWRANCHATPSAADLDSADEVTACTQSVPLDTKDQSSGWWWESPATGDICDEGRLYRPAWDACASPAGSEQNRTHWSVLSRGFIKLDQSGKYCFAIRGTPENAAAALLFSDATDAATFASGARCFDVVAGVYPIRWLYETAGALNATPTTPGRGVSEPACKSGGSSGGSPPIDVGFNRELEVDFCFGDGATCNPAEPIPQRLLREDFEPDQLPASCDHELRCTDLCPCTFGDGCSSNADCSSGFVCAVNYGAHYGFTRGGDVCAPAQCVDNPTLLGCNSSNSADFFLCGHCDPAIPCTSSADCPRGDVCGTNNGGLVGSSFTNVCWPTLCETDPKTAGCGTLSDACGKCRCSPNCSDKACGDSSDDGCGGVCTELCTEKQVGCQNDWDCPSGDVCAVGEGWRVGAQGPVNNVCLPASCVFSDDGALREQGLCGSVTSTCGLCANPDADCSGRECGVDPVTGAACGQGCTGGLVCNADGTCVLPVAADELDLELSDASTASTRKVSPLSGSLSGAVATSGAAPVSVLETLSPAINQVVPGAIPATYGVTDDGAATYEVPIETPPGRLGLKPELSLRYSSQRGNGYIGAGWTVGGASQIARCPKTMASDAISADIAYSNDDALCLDGQKLVLVAGKKGEVGAEYRTEIDTFQKIVIAKPDLCSGSNCPTVQGAAEFRVFTKDGRVLTYGGSNNALVFHVGASNVQARAWNLARVADRAGNYLSYLYANAGVGRCVPGVTCSTYVNYLSSVTWGGIINTVTTNPTGSHAPPPTTITLASAPPRYSVVFQYTTNRPDSTFGYLPQTGGDPSLIDRRLDHVLVQVGTDTVRDYALHYEAAPNGVSRLARLELCGTRDGVTRCLPESRFTYEDAFGLGPGTLVTLDAATKPDPTSTPLVFDYDGDGMDDLLVQIRNAIILPTTMSNPDCHNSPSSDEQCSVPTSMSGTDVAWNVFRNTGAEFSLVGATIQDWVTSPFGQTATYSCIDASSVFDFNNDGRQDLLDRCVRDNAIHVFVATPNGFNEVIHPITPLSDSDAVSPKRLYGTDVDGDGALDVIEFSPTRMQVYLRDIHRVNGSVGDLDHEFLPPIQVSPPDRVVEVPPLLFDVQGDGRADFLVHDSGQGWFRFDYNLRNDKNGPWRHVDVGARDLSVDTLSEGRVAYADINGDGLHDIIESAGGKLFVRPNTGAGFRGGGSYTPGSTALPLLDLDYNGDGLSDILHASAAKWLADYGRGNLTLGIDPGNHVTPQPAVTPPTNTAVGDFDGDGTTDLLLVDEHADYVLHYNKNASTNRLTEAHDGLGQYTTFQYDAVRTPAAGVRVRTYTPGTNCAWPIRCQSRVGAVVSEQHVGLIATGTPRDERKFLYTYADARSGMLGRGPLGFGQRNVFEIDGGGNEVSTSEIHYDHGDSSLTSGAFTFPLAHQITKIVRTSPETPGSAPLAAQVTRAVTQTLNTWRVATSSVGRPFPDLHERTITLYDFDSRDGRTDPTKPTADDRVMSLIETFTHDAYANVTHLDQVWQRGDDPVVLRSRSVDMPFDLSSSRTSSWLISVPLTRTERENGLARTTGFTFSASGLLQNVTREPDLITATNDDDRALYLSTDLRHNTFGNVDRVDVTDANGRTRTDQTAYDSYQLLPRRVVNAEGHATQLSFDATFGALLTRIDPNDVIDQFAYDAFGRLVHSTGPNGETNVGYGFPGFPTTDVLGGFPVISVITDEDGGFHGTEQFDAFGRLVRRLRDGIQPENATAPTIVEEFAYNRAGLLDSFSLPHILSTAETPTVANLTYDKRLRLIEEQRPDENAPDELAVTRHAYASFRTLQSPAPAGLNHLFFESTTDPRTHSTVTTSDQNGNIAAVRDPTGHDTDYVYGAFQILTTVDSGFIRRNEVTRAVRTTITPDRYGRTLVLDDPDLGKRNYHYNAFGEIETQTDALDVTTTYLRDNLGRPEHVFLGTDLQHDYTYDDPARENSIGKLTTSVAHTQAQDVTTDRVTDFFYEPKPTSTTAPNRGLLDRIERSIPGGPGTTRFAVDYDYTATGHTNTVVYPAIGTQTDAERFRVQYDYDPSGNLRTAVDGANNPIWKLTETFEGYLPQTEEQGNGVVRSSTQYQPKSRRVSHIHGDALDASGQVKREDVFAIGYHYDANGNVVQRDDVNQPPLQNFTYDSLDRLSSVTGIHPDTPQYDDLGDITSRSSSPGRGPQTYHYDAPPLHAVSRIDGPPEVGVNYLYDANGRQFERSTFNSTQLSHTTRHIDFTPFDLPGHVATTTVSGPPDNETSETKEAFFQYDAFQTRILKQSGTGDAAVITQYVGDLYERTTQGGAETQHKFRVFAGGREVAEVFQDEAPDGLTQRGIRYLHADTLGSTVAVTDETGEPTFGFGGGFDPFGTGDGPWKSTDDFTKRINTGFTGHQHDAELGLVNMKGRIYDPEAARFLTPDPFVQFPFFSQSLNRYSYVLNNPLKLIDPTGFQSEGGTGTPPGQGPGAGAGGTGPVAAPDAPGKPSDYWAGASPQPGNADFGPNQPHPKQDWLDFDPLNRAKAYASGVAMGTFASQLIGFGPLLEQEAINDLESRLDPEIYQAWLRGVADAAAVSALYAAGVATTTGEGAVVSSELGPEATLVAGGAAVEQTAAAINGAVVLSKAQAALANVWQASSKSGGGPGGGPKGSQQALQDRIKERVTQIRSGKAGQGYRNPKQYDNLAKPGYQRLPTADQQGNPITYTEHDVNPALGSGKSGFGQQRIVMGSDGRAWYTGNHYRSFVEVH